MKFALCRKFLRVSGSVLRKFHRIVLSLGLLQNIQQLLYLILKIAAFLHQKLIFFILIY